MKSRVRRAFPVICLLSTLFSFATYRSIYGATASVAHTWNAVSIGSMESNNSGFAEFKRIGSTQSWYTETTNEMQFGNWFGSRWKSYTQFDPALFSGKKITKATLHLYVNYCSSAPAGAEYASPIYVRRATSAYYVGQSWPGPETADAAVGFAGPYRHVAIDITGMANVWTDPAKNFGLAFDMGDAANTFCRAARSGLNGEVTSIELTYDDGPSLIANQSFEAGRAGWNACYRGESIAWATPEGVSAFDGSHILRFNSTLGDASICQVTPWRPRVGDYYQLAIKVRSASGNPVAGSASIWELRDPKAGPSWNTQVNFIADGVWREHRTAACARNADAAQIKSEVYIGTPNENLDVDFVQVAIANPSICTPK